MARNVWCVILDCWSLRYCCVGLVLAGLACLWYGLGVYFVVGVSGSLVCVIVG